MKSLFCRIGTKAPIANNIIKLFPEHDMYVEPFVGSGAIYFHKEPSNKEVINDIDKELISSYRLVKQVSSDLNKYQDLDTMNKITEFYNKTPKTKEDKLTHEILRTCNTFSSKGTGKLYNDSNPYGKTKNIQKYKDRMKNTTILSQDYKAVIKKYDGTNTLFYLDLPYEKSDKLYKHSEVNYAELNELLSGIKGKFILSINDSANVRQIFNKFKMKRIIVKTQGKIGIGATGTRRELIIQNF